MREPQGQWQDSGHLIPAAFLIPGKGVSKTNEREKRNEDDSNSNFLSLLCSYCMRVSLTLLHEGKSKLQKTKRLWHQSFLHTGTQTPVTAKDASLSSLQTYQEPSTL